MKVSCAIVMVLCATSGSIAGPLSPPGGPVSSTGKTIGEVEPRIAISATNTPGDADSVFKITQQGSYYLTGDLLGVVGKSGIEIEASGPVHLDLMGYTMEGIVGSLDGIMLKKQIPTPTKPNDISNGTIRSWDGAGVHLTDSVTLRDLAIESDSAVGCVAINTIGSAANYVIRQSILRTTEGPAISGTATEGMLRVVDCNIIGEGCNTSSLVGILLASVFSGGTVTVTDSVFAAAVFDHLGDGPAFYDVPVWVLTNTTATSACLLGMPGCMLRGGSINATDCTFTVSGIEVAGENTGLNDLMFLLNGSTTAPAGILSNPIGTSGLKCRHDFSVTLCPGVPVGIDIVTGNCMLDGAAIQGVPAGGVGIRLGGPATTVQDCRIAGAGAGAITAVEILAGAGNNSVINNVFVRLTGGSSVFNQGGASNAIGPVTTAANIGAATNPFANVVH